MEEAQLFAKKEFESEQNEKKGASLTCGTIEPA
jgi:hypothetical protein